MGSFSRVETSLPFNAYALLLSVSLIYITLPSSCSMWVSRLWSGSDGHYSATGQHRPQRHGCGFPFRAPRWCNVLQRSLWKSSCANVWQQHVLSGQRQRSANKSCHVMLIVSQNSASMCQPAPLEDRAIFSELQSNYVFNHYLVFP